MLNKIYVDKSDWFDFMMREAQAQPIATIKTITPEIAVKILGKNSDNRNVKERHAKTIAADLENGKWELNGEAIIIASDGTLNDGQHRLQACVLSGVSFETVIVFGVKRASRFTVDIGAARSGGDFLGMQGTTNSNNKAACARFMTVYDAGYYGTNARNYISKPEILAYYEKHKEQIDEAVQFVIPNDIPSPIKLPVSASYCILKRINPEDSMTFFHKLKTGALLSYGDPILKMREHLFDASNTRVLSHEKVELILRYWNAWRRGDTLSKRLSVSGQYPKIMQ